LSLSFDDPCEQDARDCLLRYYNSKSIAHGSYVLSIAIGFFAFIQAIPYIPEISASTIPFFENSLKEFTNIFIFSIFITSGLYLFARTLYWGVLSGYALHVSPISYQEAYRRDPAATNLIHRLNVACTANFVTHHSELSWLVGAGAGRFFMIRYLIILLAFVIVLLIFS
jgi:hypothetical protein